MEFLEKLDAETLKEELLSFLEDGEEIVELTSLGEFEEQLEEYIKEDLSRSDRRSGHGMYLLSYGLSYAGI